MVVSERSSKKIIGFGEFLRNITGSFGFYLLWLLWSFRFVVVISPQFGYIQPDEFFQFTEPVAGRVLGVEVYYPWEFNLTFPLRNMLVPQLFSTPWFYLLSYSENVLGWNIEDIKPYLLLIGPRIVITLCSFLIDFHIFGLLAILYSDEELASKRYSRILRHLLFHASWYSAMTYYTHTFGNTVELIIFSRLLVTIFTSLEHDISKINFKMGVLLSVGFFNRPTFALFALVPVLYWLSTFSRRKFRRKINLLDRIVLMYHNGTKVLKYFVLGSLFMIIVDTIFHRGIKDIYEALVEFQTALSFSKLIESPVDCLINIYQVIKQHVVLTPLNFAIYNLQTKNLANHGLHPIYFHILVSIPVLFISLTIQFCLDLILMFKHLKRWRNAKSGMYLTMFLTLIFSIACFSFIPHQEPRFLLPLAAIMFVLYNGKLKFGGVIGKSLTLVWIIVNLTLTVFYGYIHQAGIVRSMFHLKPVVNDLLANGNMDIDIFFVRMYLPPRHLLSIQQPEKVKIHDLAILDFPEPFQKRFSHVIDQYTKTEQITKRRFFVIMPSVLTGTFNRTMIEHFPYFKPRLMQSLFPHFTGEDFGESCKILLDQTTGETIINKLLKAFSMNIWYLDVVRSL